jgi:hypothetical protein
LQGAVKEHRARRQRAQEDHQDVHQGRGAAGQAVAHNALILRVSLKIMHKAFKAIAL